MPYLRVMPDVGELGEVGWWLVRVLYFAAILIKIPSIVLRVIARISPKLLIEIALTGLFSYTYRYNTKRQSRRLLLHDMVIWKGFLHC